MVSCLARHFLRPSSPGLDSVALHPPTARSSLVRPANFNLANALSRGAGVRECRTPESVAL